MNTTNLINRLPADQGVKHACQMLHNGYLSQVCGVHRVIITSGIKHTLRNGKPYYFTPQQVEALERGIHTIGAQLMLTRIGREPATEADQPLAWGDDFIQKFTCLRQHINIKHIFQDRMGWTESKHKLRLSHPEEEKYYGIFSDAELEEINTAIHAVALDLCSLKLECDGKGEKCDVEMDVEDEVVDVLWEDEVANDTVREDEGNCYVTVDEAFEIISDMVSLAKVAEVAGITYSTLCAGKTHSVQNGKPYYLTPDKVKQLQEALMLLGTQLMDTEVSLDPVSEEESPLAWGDNIVEQLGVLRRTVKLGYIFETVMGKNRRWYQNRVGKGEKNIMSGRFDDGDLRDMNHAIQMIAATLCSIRLVASEF